MESFFHTLKTELVMHCDYRTRDQARASVFDYGGVLQPPAAALDNQLRGTAGLRDGTNRLITVSIVRGQDHSDP